MNEKRSYKKVLTKSNYLLGLQCSKLLWVKLYDKTRIPAPDDFAMYRFGTGMRTEDMAKTLFPDGIDIPREDFLENLKQSTELLKKRVPLFEPSFKFDQLYSRGDVLVPVNEDEWDIVEMKSATKVKEVNLHDVSFQKYVYEKCGLKIRKSFVMHINRDYERSGDLDISKLFVQTEVTEDIKKLEVGIKERIETMLEIVNSKEIPKYIIGSHCTDPYECPIKRECWAELPGGNILDYYQKNRIQCFKLGDFGQVKINRIPEYYSKEHNPFQKQAVAVQEGNGFEKRVIGKFFDELKYPVYYLDIRAINPAIPKFDGMRPYQKIAFQFSLHIQTGPHSNISHVSFLSDGKTNPRFLLLKILKDHIGSDGTILVFDKYKESVILRDLAKTFFSFKPWIYDSVLPRIKSVWEVFENFHYFDIEKTLNHSIQFQLPKFCDITDKDLDVIDGEHRQLAYEKWVHTDIDELVAESKEDESEISLDFKKGVVEEKVEEVRKDLRKKSREETLSLIHIVDAFGKIVEST
ncbi:DUF2779 domain-containing protein [archaeon]|jgi:hypothetical protein|nr:DUF2779 domain-containing protein [archaeon]MBT6182378.1 DUF2779 domain-containing protein [archaeon]MBT6606543.1 DUF2779 domain-containing protein [archaeon]MBT7251830.1 DUF2779 domain-containing protein [archaeon]MBT7661092.1 DUF2779 domain-containing protein [archaeon]